VRRSARLQEPKEDVMKPTSCWEPGTATPGALRHAFDASALSLTVGAEEELMLVGADGRLAAGIGGVLERLEGDQRFRAEFRASQVELVTRPFLSAADVGRELATARIELAEAVAPETRPLACGTHPTARSLGPITDGERYREVAADNPWAARHMLTCGLHVHVALSDADRALAVYNALRSYLPELAALAANSPFHRSLDTGLASTRLQLSRGLARHGVPPAFPDWDAYAAFVAWGRAGGALRDPSYHWWDLRLHPRYGTLELRACDTQTDVADAVALIALAQTLVAWLAARHDDGERLPVHDAHRIAESLWLAGRDGPRALPDLDSGRLEPVVDRVGALLEALAPVAADLGTGDELARVATLAHTGRADLQRALVRRRGLTVLLETLAARTLDSARGYLDAISADDAAATEPLPAAA
jgi:carboxylate-amine ligase